MTTAEPTAADRSVPSAVAELDTMQAPALALVQPVKGSGSARYTDVYLYAGPTHPTSYYAYPLRLRWFLNPAEAASLARTLRRVADAIDADEDVRIGA